MMVQRLGSILRNRKSLLAIQAEEETDAKDTSAKLTLFDLLCIGIGSTVGSGVFILTGDILPKAGPSAILSWAIAGSVCLLSALSYIELCMKIPTSGSCYTFSYHALGELAAVVGSVCLTMEYGISGAGVARGWSVLVGSLTGCSESMFFWYPGVDRQTATQDLYFDFTAGLIMAVCVVITSSGLTIGKLVINAFTIMKGVLLVFLVIAGFCAWNVDIFESHEVFFPHGMTGMFNGVSALFFGFIGFDEVCCLAGRAERPTYTMPRALAGTLAVAAGVSMLAQFSLAVMGPSEVARPWPAAFEAQGWMAARLIANIGEVVLLPLVVLLSFLPQPELLGTMAKDGLISAAFARTDRAGTYVWGSNASGAIMILVAAMVPFGVLWNMISLGVLLGFNLTNSSLIMIRYGNGGEVTAPVVGYLVAGLWLFAAVGGYVFWQGFAAPVLDGKPWEWWGPTVSGISLVAALATLFAISRHPDQSGHYDAKATFRTPAVPFVPGIAIILNFMLMATMSWTDHLYLFVCIFLSVVLFIACKHGGDGNDTSATKPKKVQDQPENLEHEATEESA